MDRPPSRPVRAIPERSARHRALDIQGVAARFRLARAAVVAHAKSGDHAGIELMQSAAAHIDALAARLIGLGVTPASAGWRSCPSHGAMAFARHHGPSGGAGRRCTGRRIAACTVDGGIDCGLTPALFFKDIAGDAGYRNRNGGRASGSAGGGAPSRRGRKADRGTCRPLPAHAPQVVLTCARGSSAHAATFGKHLIERHLGILWRPRRRISRRSMTKACGSRISWFLIISQSGHSYDLVEFAGMAKESGALTAAIVNGVDSPSSRHATLFCR